MIEVQHLTKCYGSNVAVRDLSFTALPGHVTGFLGPNGSGKSTTMRVVLGLDAPTRGEARVNGRRYVELRNPLREVGALLDARAFHPGRTARNHLLALARSTALPAGRVDQVLDAVGLLDVGRQRVGGFSLGMSQRLGIAAALLGDPGVVLFDEPMNGLDTEGIRWIRRLLMSLAGEGRTVLVSSHLMREIELVADRLVVIGRGRLLAEASAHDFLDNFSNPVTVVRTTQPETMHRALERAGATAEPDSGGGWRVTGATAVAVGELAHAHGVIVHELRTVPSSLEDIFTELTAASVDYAALDRGGRAGARSQ